MNGIINVLKPPGMTSHDVVSFVRRVYGLKKVGHAGTLDPAAAGVLPVFIGCATRLIEYTTDTSKSYRAEITFGYETDTGDDTGTVTCTGSVTGLEEEKLSAALAQFRGSITQIPPAYSAIKKDGKKLYELARAGLAVQADPRQVMIEKLELVGLEAGKAIIDVDCSKGTYIRTLCQDIGRAIECPATMSFLIRTRVGFFSLAQAVTLEEIEENKNEVLLPMEGAVKHLESLSLGPVDSQAFCQGKLLSLKALKTGPVSIYNSNGMLLGIGSYCGDTATLKPLKVLSRV